ncbi:hypothetical protein LRR80_04832 [Streptomyces sp. RO-S4]|nr:hypothetical protein [Streptomyces sp. RO-S4]MCO4698744.1 hypothetical protein [Streptomyces sp. RO-S4]
MVTHAAVKEFTLQEYDDEFAIAKSSAELSADKPAIAPLGLALTQLPLG